MRVPAELSPEERVRYDRQIRYSGCGETGQLKLKMSRVVVIGAGGLGSAVLTALVTSGVGHVILYEFDDVSLSNLHRQPLYTTDDVGRPKAQAAYARLRALNPNVELTIHETPLSIETDWEDWGKIDIIIDCTDRLSARSLIAACAQKLRIPHSYASVSGDEGQLALFYPDEPCYRCLVPHLPRGGEILSCDQAGVIGVAPQLIGVMQAAQVIHFLLEENMKTRELRGHSEITHNYKGKSHQFKLGHHQDCPLCMPVEDPELIQQQRGRLSSLPLSPLSLARRLSSGWRPQLLDVRTEDEFQREHLLEALNIPIQSLEEWSQSPSGMEISSLNTSVLYSNDLVIYCERGPRAERAAAIIGALRATSPSKTASVYELVGGIRSLKEALDLSVSSTLLTTSDPT